MTLAQPNQISAMADEVRLGASLAVGAGVALAASLPRKRSITYKSSIDLLTEMDGASEEFIFDRIRRAFPHDDILSEEGRNRATRSPRRWLVDPLDGTTNYAHGIPFFCVSLALEVEGRIELGVVFAPMLGELYIARRGRGAFLVVGGFADGSAGAARAAHLRTQRFAMARAIPLPSVLVADISSKRVAGVRRNIGQGGARAGIRHGAVLFSQTGACPLRVSNVRTLRRAMLVTGFPYDVHSRPGNYFRWFRRFCLAAQAVRRLGSAAIDMCYVAAGRMDGFWESKLHAWDTAAAWLIVEEAGGRVTNFSGGPFDMFGTETLATNGLLHRKMMKVLKD